MRGKKFDQNLFKRTKKAIAPGLASRSKIDTTLTLTYFFSSTPTPTSFLFLFDSDKK